MDAAIDRKALHDISYGLYIVTSLADGKINGQIVNTVFQVTSEPARIAVCINKENLTHDFVTKSGVMAVSTLEQDVPLTFIGTFGFKSGRDIDKFSQCSYTVGVTGCPVVTDYALSSMEGKVVSQADAGTHTVFVVELVASSVFKAGIPLTYAYYQDVKKGKASKNAPTYKGDISGKAPENPKQETKTMSKYECKVCGYTYDPEVGDPDSDIPAGTAFEDLPDSWVCPICGAQKSDFEKI